MISRLGAWLRDEQGRRDEKSNTFAMFVIALPVILGSFGMGIDLARNVYIRTSLQNDLDMAVVGGAAAGIPRSYTGAPDLRPAAGTVRSTARSLYGANRAVGPGLSCLTGNQARCWKETTSNVGSRTFTYTIQERAQNSFLGVLDDSLRYQTFNLTSKATINQNTE